MCVFIEIDPKKKEALRPVDGKMLLKKTP